MINFHMLISKTGSKDGARASFEEMLAQLIRLSQPGVRRVEANPGDWGIDVFVGQLRGRINVWQIKFFIDGVRETQQQEVRESLASLMANAQAQGFRVNTWTLCIPCSMAPKATKWWDGWKKRAESKNAITIQLWDETELRNLLLSPGAGTLREAYFGLNTLSPPTSTTPAQSVPELYPLAAPTILTRGPNLSASMLRQIKNVSIRPEIAREAERVLGHVDYPKIMSLSGNLVDNPVWSDVPYDEQIRLTASRRPDADKCPLFMVVPSLFLVVLVTGGALALLMALRSGSVRTTMIGVLRIFAGLLPGRSIPKFSVPEDRTLTVPYGVAIMVGGVITLALLPA